MGTSRPRITTGNVMTTFDLRHDPAKLGPTRSGVVPGVRAYSWNCGSISRWPRLLSANRRASSGAAWRMAS